MVERSLVDNKGYRARETKIRIENGGLFHHGRWPRNSTVCGTRVLITTTDHWRRLRRVEKEDTDQQYPTELQSSGLSSSYQAQNIDMGREIQSLPPEDDDECQRSAK